MHLVVDGMNVIGSRPDGWWRDRPRARQALVAAIARSAPELGAERLTVVFDGSPSPAESDAAPAAVEVLYAPGGPNAADDRIVSFVRSLPDPASVVVVTSDAALKARVRDAGAAVEGVKGFRARLAGESRH